MRPRQSGPAGLYRYPVCHPGDGATHGEHHPIQCLAGVDDASLPRGNLGIAVPFHSRHFKCFKSFRIALVGKGAVYVARSAARGAASWVLAPIAAVDAF